MGYKVDSLEVELTVSAKQAATSLNAIATSLKKVKKEAKSLVALKNLRKELSAFSRVNLTPVADALKVISSASTTAQKKLKNMLDESKNAVKNTSDIITGDIFTVWADDLPDVNEQLIEFSDNEAEVADTTEKLAKETKKSAEATKKLNDELNDGSESADKAEKSVKRLHKSHSRFVKYAMYRGVRAAFNAITQSFTEGLKEAYAWSQEASNGYENIAETMDSIQTGITQMRRQIGAGVGELMAKLQPVFNFIFDAINAIFDKVTQFFAVFNGEDTYMKAKKIDTAWQEVEDNTKGATDALKDYKKQLLGIDELNVLGKDEDKAGATAPEIPESIYELAKVENGFLADLAINLKDLFFKWDDLDSRDIGKKICDGLGMATGGIIGFAFGGVGGALIGSIAGLVLGVTVSTLLFDDKKMKFANETFKNDLISTVVSGLGGAAAGFMVGGLPGAAIGLVIGAGISIVSNAMTTTIEEEALERYLESDFKKKIDDFVESRINPLVERSIKIKEKVEGILPTLDSEEVASLETAKTLIEEIYDLGGKENKTVDDIIEIQSKIEVLNGMNIDGVKLEFNQLTGEISGSKEATLELIDSMLSIARVKAGEEKLTELYKAEYDAKALLIEKDKEYKDWLDILNGKQTEYEQSTRNRIDAESKLESVQKALKDAYLEQERAGFMARDGQDEWVKKSLELNNTIVALRNAESAWIETVKEAKIQEQEHLDGIIDMTSHEQDFQKAVDNATISLEEAASKTQTITDLIIQERKAQAKNTSAVEKNTEVMGLSTEATGELANSTTNLTEQISQVTDAEKNAKKNLVKYTDAMGNTRTVSNKLIEAMNSVKGAFNEVKASIASTISELGKLDEAGKTKRTIELDYAVGVNMSDAAMFGMLQGMGNYNPNGITQKASGGFVEGGHLFFANENGNPEYIGNINGRTAVANSDQMSTAIEQAAYSGFARALQQYGNKNTNEWQPMSAEEMYLLLKRKADSTSLRTGMAY